MTPRTKKSRQQTEARLHRVWTDHAIWTRQYVVAAIDARPELSDTAARWLRCADELGDAFGEFYPRPTARRIAKLLRQHVTVAIDLVDAAWAEDKLRFVDIDDVWANTGMDLVDELCKRNDSWSRDELRAQWDLMREQTTLMLVARIEQNFDRDIDAFDELLTATLRFADHIAAGLVRQFADRFAA
jgi:hypothetical protein